LDAFDYGHGYVNPGLQIHRQDINDQKTDRVRDPNVAGSEIYLQGYRGPDVGIDDFEDQNVTDIMEAASNVDEPIYASKKPKRVDMSEIEDPDNATIEVTLQKFDSGLNPDVVSMRNETERLKNQLLNQSTAELESLFRDNPNCSTGPNWKPATRNCKTS